MLANNRLNWSKLLVIVMFFGFYTFFIQAKSADAVKSMAEVVTEADETQNNVIHNISTATLLQALMLNEGAGNFSQHKHFKFLAVPIRSTGHFVVKQKNVSWQTQSPVFSEILIQPNGIYRRLSPEAGYEQLVDNSEFSLLLATVFTGDINPLQWQIGEGVSLVENIDLVDGVDLVSKNYCLSLKPKAKQLQELFQHVDLCLASLQQEGIDSEAQSRFDLSKRHINLFDPQGNKTQIFMQINTRALTTEQIQALTFTASVSNTSNEESSKQENVNAH